jgi:predicted lipoprotein with Yx(FWY)xxD motif
MHRRLAFFVASALALAACGGGGSGGAAVAPQPSGGATTAPAAQGNLPLSEAVAGSPAWVNPSSHKTLYFLDVDTATGGTCTQAANGCLALWPPLTPSAGSVATANMTIITRSDGTGQQWAYQGHPLYTFTGDTGPDQANGDNFPDFGGFWHVARPSASTTPTGPTGPPACTGPYC